MPRFFLMTGAVLAGLGVMAGAFGAHGLQSMVTPERLATFDTAVQYHTTHALALLLVGLLLENTWQKPLCIAGYLLLAGIAVFSGSLYLLVLTDTPWLGAITPLGGVAFMLGWGFFAVAVWKRFPESPR